MHETIIPRPRISRAKANSNKYYRSATMRAQVDEGARMVALSFSSETDSVLRHSDEAGAAVPEILSHADGAADFETLLELSSVLRNHDPNQIVGAPYSAEVKNRRGVAVIRFSRSKLGMETFEDVKNGILRGLSFGYEPVEEEFIPAGKRNAEGIEGPAIFVKRWRALEISLTPIPADASVGIGRTRRHDEDDEACDESEDDEACDESEDDDEAQRMVKAHRLRSLELIRDVREGRISADEALQEMDPEAYQIKCAIDAERTRILKITNAARAGRITEAQADDWIEDGSEFEN